MTEYGRKHTDGSRSGGQPVLLPCPFCATAPVHFDNAYGTGYIIYCPEDDDCMVGPYVEMGTKEQSIAAWNTRQPTQSDALKAENERLRRLLSVQPSNPIAPDPLFGWTQK